MAGSHASLTKLAILGAALALVVPTLAVGDVATGARLEVRSIELDGQPGEGLVKVNVTVANVGNRIARLVVASLEAADSSRSAQLESVGPSKVPRLPVSMARGTERVFTFHWTPAEAGAFTLRASAAGEGLQPATRERVLFDGRLGPMQLVDGFVGLRNASDLSGLPCPYRTPEGHFPGVSRLTLAQAPSLESGATSYPMGLACVIERHPLQPDADGDGFGGTAFRCGDPFGGAAPFPCACPPAGIGCEPACGEPTCDGACPGFTCSELCSESFGCFVVDVLHGADCDDQDAARHPSADERTNQRDDDCDGEADEHVPEQDLDGDGVTNKQGDCDDRRANVKPGAAELDDDRDNDCDGGVDEDFVDSDGDGFTMATGDCAEGNPLVSPGAPERFNGIDDDCDGQPDEGFSDADHDGAPAGPDCNDDDPGIHPEAWEARDSVDNDCDGTVDDCQVDGLEPNNDAPEAAVSPRDLPEGQMDRLSLCDAVDEDWFLVDAANPFTGQLSAVRAVLVGHAGLPLRMVVDGVEVVATPTGDGSVVQATPVDDPLVLVAVGPGAVASAYRLDVQVVHDSDGDGAQDDVDCEPFDGAVHPGAEEVVDDRDNDCDGGVDDDPAFWTTWYADADGDGYGDPDAGQLAPSASSGFVADGADCDDDDSSVHPDALEHPNGVDDDCDGLVDEDDG